MKSIFRLFSIFSILCLVSILILSCSTETNQEDNNTNSTSIVAGFEFLQQNSDPQPYTALRCAYKFDSYLYDINSSVPVTLYYGADIEKRTPNKESSSLIKIFIDNVNYEEMYMTITEISVDEIFKEKYDISINYDENRNDVSRVSFNYSEKIEIPYSMFTASKGILRISIKHYDEFDVQNNGGRGYGGDYQVIYYEIKDNKLIISDKYQPNIK